MNYCIKDPKQVVLHAQGASGAGFIDGVWNRPEPPKKEWVGLTDEDYKELSKIAFVEVIEKIERVLKEKNA